MVDQSPKAKDSCTCMNGSYGNCAEDLRSIPLHQECGYL